MFNKEAFVQATDQEWTMTLDGSDPLPAKQWFCFKFLCHSCSPQTQRELRLPQPTERSHETHLKTSQRVGGFVLSYNARLVIYAWTERQWGNLFVGSEDEIMWVYSAVHGAYNVSVTLYHPPPEHRLQGGLYSGLRSSLCLCRKEHAMWWDEDAVKFPVGWKHLDLWS